MSRTVLQIPIDLQLRQQAENAAEKAGFSSVQEVVRVFLNKFASHKITISFDEHKLSPAAEKRYDRIVKDIQDGKNIVDIHSTEELFSVLK